MIQEQQQRGERRLLLEVTGYVSLSCFCSFPFCGSWRFGSQIVEDSGDTVDRHDFGHHFVDDIDGDVFARDGRHTGHKVVRFEGANDDTALKRGRLLDVRTIKVKGNQHQRHLAQPDETGKGKEFEHL